MEEEEGCLMDSHPVCPTTVLTLLIAIFSAHCSHPSLFSPKPLTHFTSFHPACNFSWPLSHLLNTPLQSVNCPSCPGLVISQPTTRRATSCHHNLISCRSSLLLSTLYYCIRVRCLASSWHGELRDGRSRAAFQLWLACLLAHS